MYFKCNPPAEGTNQDFLEVMKCYNSLGLKHMYVQYLFGLQYHETKA